MKNILVGLKDIIWAGMILISVIALAVGLGFACFTHYTPVTHEEEPIFTYSASVSDTDSGLMDSSASGAISSGNAAAFTPENNEFVVPET